MLIVHVDVQVVAGQSKEFVAASVANAKASLQEPGVVRFDLIADLADEEHFLLVEVYQDDAAAAAHKATSHYATWRDTVAPMMARPRSSTKFEALPPAEPERWATRS